MFWNDIVLTAVIRILLATLTPGSVSADYHESVCDLLENPLPGVTVKRILVRGGPVPAHQRNVACKYFLGTESDCLLFVDSDNKFSRSDLRILIDSDKDIVGARYYGYSVERDQVYPTWEPLNGSEPNNGLLECKHVGMGFTLIRRGAFERLHNRPFGYDVIDGLDAQEDVTFCHRARSGGLGVFINVDARVFHAKTKLI